MCVFRCKHKSSEENNKIFLDGKCDCPRLYQPVCAEGNKNFFNECFRECAGK